MKTNITTKIDKKICTGCGLCLKVCPSESLLIKNKKALMSGNKSMLCGHCAAACPVGAIEIDQLEPFSFMTFSQDDRWLPHGEFDTAALVRLMGSRRSCRNYTNKPVSRELLDDLVKIGATAPSGTNSQKWTFTLLCDRGQMLTLGNEIAACFKKLNRLAEKRIFRLWSRIFGNDELGNYYRRYYQSMKEGLMDWEQKGRDRLFHGATAVIMVGASPGASCPREDALLATQNILLAAHAMGLGSCLIGFAVAAINRTPEIKELLEIPQEEQVYSFIALGHPDEGYRKTAERKKIIPRYPVCLKCREN